MSGQKIFDCYLEFKENETRIAKLANDICKFMTIKQAVDYEIGGKISSALEFINSYNKQINDFTVRKSLRIEQFRLQDYKKKVTR